MALPYKESQNPNEMYVMHYNDEIENWEVIPKTGINTETKQIYFNSLNLGIFGLAEITSEYRGTEWADGGFRFTDNSKSYFYTLTVATVSNYKYSFN
ncbi:MAG: hypothetical protein R2771_11680 [Saprospiraceae bacterium]